MTQPPTEWSSEGQAAWGQPPPPAPRMPPPPLAPPTWEQQMAPPPLAPPTWEQQMAPPQVAPPQMAPPPQLPSAWGQTQVPEVQPQWGLQQTALPPMTPPPYGQTPVTQVTAQQPVDQPMWMQAHPGRIGSTIPGYEWTATPAPRSTAMVGEMRPFVESRWFWGIAAALGVAVVVAAATAAFAVAVWRFEVYVSPFVALYVGATLRLVGRVSGVGAALVGLVIAAVGWALTVLFTVAGVASDLGDTAFLPMLQSVFAEWSDVLRVYVEVNPTAWIGLLAVAAAGFIGANSKLKMLGGL